MNKLIVFDSTLSGHHLEYIHHIYIKALSCPSILFIFVIPYEFRSLQNSFEWKEAPNIIFDFVDFSSVIPESNKTYDLLLNSFRLSRLLNKACKKHKCFNVFLPVIMGYLPFLPYISPKRLRVSGIVYRIYLREIADNQKGSLIDRLKFRLFARKKTFKTVFILNDKKSADNLNCIYNTSKFKYIPDPYVPIVLQNTYDIRDLFGISEEIIITHVGYLNENKGTIKFLESIIEFDQSYRNKIAFIVAGRVSDEIKGKFDEYLEIAKQKFSVLFIEGFLEYDMIGSLCIASDALALPYFRTSQSSGIIGYASQFSIPVIAPNKGLLGDLVQRYGLGIAIDKVDIPHLHEAYKKILERRYTHPSNQYCLDNELDSFGSIIIGSYAFDTF